VSYELKVLAKVFAAELIVCSGYEEKGIVKRNESTEGNIEILNLAGVVCRFFFAAKLKQSTLPLVKI